MHRSLSFAGTCIAGLTIALAVTIAPALANTKILDFESSGSIGEVTPFKGETMDGMGGTKVQVMSFTFGVGKDGHVPGTAVVGAGAGKVNATTQSLSVVVGAEATEKIFKLAASGKAIPMVRFTIFSNANGHSVPVVTALMSHVLIVSDEWQGKAIDKPTGKVTLDFSSIEIQKNKNSGALDPGTTQTGWNRVENTNDFTTSIP